jgi:cytochrome c-type biogenesis protein CcmH
MRSIAWIVGAWLMGASLAFAVTPDEILDDPQLERRARAISAELRCMVCQNQSIDDSDADLAKDLRVLVRDRLVAGDTNDEVFAYVVSRYGEFVLLRPRFSVNTALLWGAPILVLILGSAAIIAFLRSGRGGLPEDQALSAREKAELDRLMKR